MATELRSSDISDAGFLAAAAYGSSVQTVLAGSSWNPVDPTAFGINSLLVGPGLFYSVHVPGLIDAQAMLAYNSSTHTLAISFRGTDGITDLYNDLVLATLNSGIIYTTALFDLLVRNVLAGASAFGATRILVTGHSLGGAMAEEVMARYPDTPISRYKAGWGYIWFSGNQ